MRLLNRSAGRLSRHRRGPLAGLVVLLLGPAAHRRPVRRLLPATAQADETADDELIAQGRELFLVGCAFCHGQNAEGIRTDDGDQYGPLAGRRRRRRRRLPGRHRPDADGPARRPGPAARRRVYTEEEIEALAAYVASLGPGPAIPDEDDYSIEGLSDEEREEAIVRGGQIFLTNCTACHNFAGSGGAHAARPLRPEPHAASSAKHIYEAMLTGPQQMPVFSDGVLTPEDKRDVIAYLKTLEETARLRRLRPRRPRPGLRGPVRLAASASAPASASRSGSPPTRPARTKKKVDA